MIDLASALTVPIAKLLLKSWLGDTAADMGVGLFQLGLKRLGDRTKARSAQHRAEEIADAVIADLERFFANEHVGKEKLAVAATALGDTIEQNVDATFLVHQKLNADAIEQELLKARPVDQIYRSAEPEHGWYKQLVKPLAPRLRAVAPELPGFERERDAVILQKLHEVAAAAPQLLELLQGVHEKLDELRQRPIQLAQGFERDYLDALATELDYVEILGIEELDSKSCKAALSVAYLSLTARFGDKDDQQKVDFATVLTLMPLFGNRLWVEGGAGSGKSTLVRWAALQAARWRLGQASDPDILDVAPDLDGWLNFLRPQPADKHAIEESSPNISPLLDLGHRVRSADREHPDKAALRAEAWRARLPFVAFLRHAPEGLTLTGLPHLCVHTIGTPPEGWLQEAVADAGAGTLLIFDGVDEVPVGRKRERILSQIEHFAERFPSAQVLVTSRPGAVDSGTLSNFQKVVLEDLSESQRLGFIDHWHRALAANSNRERNDAVIAELRRAALRELERQPSLALLATNPLLCSAICALHWLSRRKVVEEAWQGHATTGSMQGSVLPGSLWNLCEALTRMLVHQRDFERDLGGASFGPAYTLSYEQKRETLARIAYGMVAGDLLSAMTRKDTLAHVQAALDGFRDQIFASAEEVLQALLERSGVLRGSGEDEVEYVHNTLKAFLAAKFYLGLLTHDEVVRRIAAGSPEELASGLDEIAVFAAASPDHAAYAERLINALLSGREARSDVRKLRILALRCETAASSHLTEETRGRVRALAPKLFPPRDLHEARQLATLGKGAVKYLHYRARTKATTSAAAVHCLRLIGTAAAHDAARAYLATESLVVAEELIGDHNPLEVAAVLKAAQDLSKWQEVSPFIKSAIRGVAPLANLTNLRFLVLDGTQVADAAPLANLTNLQALYLDGTQVADAAPLANLINLQGLGLKDTQVADAAPLANLTNLQFLGLDGTQVADAAPLANLTNLQALGLNDTQVADAAPLANLTNLQTLGLKDTQVADAAPLANLTNLQWLYLAGTEVADAAPLANLTNLEWLALNDTQIADAAPLANLTRLRMLDLSGTQVADAAPLANLTNLQTLYLFGTRVADAAPLANLTKLKRLALSGTQVTQEAIDQLRRELAARGNASVEISGP